MMFEINVGALVQKVGFPGCFKLYTPVKPTLFEIDVGAVVQNVGFPGVSELILTG